MDGDNLLVINGMPVHRGYLVENIIWNAVTTLFGVAVWVQWRRLSTTRRSRRGSCRQSRSKTHDVTRTQWTHITVIWLMFACLGVDFDHIYFDGSIWISYTFFAEIVLLFTSFLVLYCFAHLEAYRVAQSALHPMGEWMPKMRRWWLVVNLTVGNALMLFTFSHNRARFKYLPQLWVGIQCIFLSVALAVIARKLNSAVRRMASLVQSSNGPIMTFKRRSYLTTFLSFFFGAAFVVYFLDEFLSNDPEQTFTSFESRADRVDFVFTWYEWLSFLALAWAMYLYWIPKVRPHQNRSPSPKGCAPVAGAPPRRRSDPGILPSGKFSSLSSARLSKLSSSAGFSESGTQGSFTSITSGAQSQRRRGSISDGFPSASSRGSSSGGILGGNTCGSTRGGILGANTRGFVSGGVTPIGSTYGYFSNSMPSINTHGSISGGIPSATTRGSINAGIPSANTHNSTSGGIPGANTRGSISVAIPNASTRDLLSNGILSANTRGSTCNGILSANTRGSTSDGIPSANTRGSTSSGTASPSPRTRRMPSLSVSLFTERVKSTWQSRGGMPLFASSRRHDAVERDASSPPPPNATNEGAVV